MTLWGVVPAIDIGIAFYHWDLTHGSNQQKWKAAWLVEAGTSLWNLAAYFVIENALVWPNMALVSALLESVSLYLVYSAN